MWQRRVTARVMDSARAKARQLAAESLERDAPLGCFEPLHANGDEAAIRWADMRSNPHLTGWLDRTCTARAGRRPLVVGCSLGNDAEDLARHDFAATVFDIAPTAVDWCRRRFPALSVEYAGADVLALPAAWAGAFDLVVEADMRQMLPPGARGTAMGRMALGRPRPCLHTYSQRRIATIVRPA